MVFYHPAIYTGVYMDFLGGLIVLFLLVGIPIIVILYIISAIFGGNKKKRILEKKPFAYTAKNAVMTASEMDFFWKLNEVVQDRYFIFPQVHLSALLDHRIIGQDWRRAFYHINAKSVDYVLCSKATLQPLYAIELDDPSHDRVDRMVRDVEVERIFDEANVPLVRFRDYKNLNHTDIAHSLANARKLSIDRAEVKTTAS